jgi:hypothetical protein
MVSNFAFAPSSVSVPVGTTVEWTNHDTAPHDVTVTSGPVAIHSPTLTTGQSWSYAFTVAGTYAYICSIHPDMHATLTVRPAAPPPSVAPAPVAVSPARTAVAQPNATAPGSATGASQLRTAAQAAPSASASPLATQPPAATTTVTVAAAPTASTVHELKPLLIVAGVVAAVATFCLLLLASARDAPAGD